MIKEKQLIEKLAKKAGKIALSHFGSHEKVKTKAGKTDLVTSTDIALNKMITDAIKKSFPDHGIISEEDKAYQKDSPYQWIVDPIDGTNNYATGIPLFGVMIALAKNEEVILSGIYLPITKEYFRAEKGKGAFKNDKRIHTTKKLDWPETFGLTTSFKTKRKHHMNKAINKLSDTKSVVINSFGCMALTCTALAEGKRDWLVYDGGSIWDRAPATLLLQESGCKVTNFDGEKWKFPDTKIIAAHAPLHKKLYNIVKKLK